MSAGAHISNVRAACEVAIGKAHPRAAEAVVICLLDMEARLERHALERRANCIASNPERPRRQRYCTRRSRAAKLERRLAVSDAREKCPSSGPTRRQRCIAITC